ncbi:MAG: hypothetical protein K0S71_1938 [Clostridia bacterium]|jgi:hypothetical protein|nr:hypothetical protein [Clostridia bacterium]
MSTTFPPSEYTIVGGDFMSANLKISEVIENIITPSDNCIRAQIKMTNTSNTFINNLKLIIKAKEIAILEKSVIRQRGALSFDAAESELDVGNLAPDETAYFEYAFKPIENINSLSSQMIISYTPEYSDSEVSENVTELLNE